MRSVTINCQISIGVEESFDPELTPTNDSNEFLQQLFKDNTFLERMASYFQDEKYVKNVSVVASDMIDNTCNITVNFNSEYTNRVVNKVMEDNFYHYLRSGGIAKYTNGGELFISLSDFKFNDTESEGLIGQIDSKRNCTVCTDDVNNAYIYFYDKNNDMMNSSCIFYDESTFNLDDHLYPIIRGALYKYKITDTNHNVLKEVIFV